MSTHETCPSKKDRPAALSRRRPVNPATGKTLWRSLDDLADEPAFRQWLEREFPAGASELLRTSRRSFLKYMGASAALAGLASMPGCRRPDHKIVPYNRAPEEVIPGKSLYYASAIPLPGGGCEGVLVETHEGRPTKIEGNPLHPYSKGRTSVRAQATVLSLYDPERLKGVTRRSEDGGREPSSWEEFEAFARRHFAAYDRTGGAGLTFLADRTSSLSRRAMVARLKQRWPQARWLTYDPLDSEDELTGARLAFGGAVYRPRHAVDKATVVLSLGRDFLGVDSTLPEIRGFAAGRRVLATHGPGSEMNRLYVVESDMTLTGFAADHRLRLRPSDLPAAAAAIARAVVEKKGGSSQLAAALATTLQRFADAKERLPSEWIEAVADDLIEAGSRALVMAGPGQPAEVHALVHALNATLGAAGSTVVYDPVDQDDAVSSREIVSRLAAEMRSGAVKTLVVMGCNPVFDAPADLDFLTAYKQTPTTIQLSFEDDETGVNSTWQLNAAHVLESWSDVVAHDGTPSVVQPTIAPLYGGKTDIELLAILLDDKTRDGHDLVRRTWQDAFASAGEDFEKLWRRALHDGLLQGRARRGDTPGVNFGAVATALTAFAPRRSKEGELDVVFRPCAKVRDGFLANNGWLQELPDPVTKITWDNPALVSPATFRKLGLQDFRRRIGVQHAPTAKLRLDGREMEIAVWPSPGVADDTVVLTAGYGRYRVGRVGEGVGFNTYALRTSSTWRGGPGATVTPVNNRYEIATVQDHHSLTPPEAPDSPRADEIMREFHVESFRRFGDEVVETRDHYGRVKRLNFAERIGVGSHAPANKDIYTDWQIEARQQELDGRHQWGMTIDLSSCIGCGACTIACQAENNIPVVGKEEVTKGREMHWIRVDRYYSGGEEGEGDVEAHVQPIACVHCEEAPCETVCPVNATNHGREGTNDMVYNRCIGTRYCSNNCPYKVRRFNFFDYATKRYKGDIRLLVKDGPPEERKAIPLPWINPSNRHLVPPRIRERIQDAEKGLATMQYNPNVTVRSRGVMEKCSYCIQRIHEAKMETKLNGWDRIPDGYFQTACQQACPAEAIVFGDKNNPDSALSKLQANGRAYQLLGYLNIRPRTMHLARLRNRNPRLMSQEELARMENPFSHHGEAEGSEQGHDDGQHASAGRNAHTAAVSLPVLGQNAGREAAAALTGGLA
ncbi:MAG: 4Fe-4S dicluster domain-containing protein [Planctomycetota bacterium]|nr:MAG: 4Fe-4S dicluster domain-containing protein [Planctomycetota bacterium]